MKNQLFIIIFSALIILVIITNSSRVNKVSAGSESFILTEPLTYNTSEEDVKKLKELLIEFEIDFGISKADEVFDDNTLAAVKAIQKYSKITVDGEVGNDTFNAINKLLQNKSTISVSTIKEYQLDFFSMIQNGKNLNKISLDENLQNLVFFNGNINTPAKSRRNNTPKIIVNNKIENDSFKNINELYTSKQNQTSSTHFVIKEDGLIYQYITLSFAANVFDHEIKPEQLSSTFVKNNNIKDIDQNAIYISYITKGNQYSPEQIKSSIWLHKYIIEYVKDNYNYTIKTNRSQILGLNEVSPFNIIDSPGGNFPWFEIINGINKQ